MGKRPRGPLPNWQPSTIRQQGILGDLIDRYLQHRDEDTLPRGPRGIFYDLRPDGMGHGITYRKPDSAHPITSFEPNTEAHPEAVREVLVLARRAGIIPESWVADTRAPAGLVPSFDADADEVADAIASIVTNAKVNLDPQSNQSTYLEVLCEAEDLMPRLERVAAPYGVPVYSGGGFDGLKGKRAFGERAAERGVLTVVLHVGDRDDHGDNIFTAAAEDSVAWAEHLGGELSFHRLALTVDQAEEHGLLDADGKAEVDGLPVPVMDQLLTEAIEWFHNSSRREALEAEQERERTRLPDAIKQRLDGQL